MIDIKELRRLAQAATSGPWYVTGKLTRYVEARIDGGLIQEVAACGPTKADGGYGPQQEANARLLAAANPATLSELLDRLEAAEKERDWNAERLEDAVEELTALRAELETERMRLAACGVVALSNTPDSAKQARDMLPEYWSASCGDVARMVDENISLRAKIEQMERQEPVGEIQRANSTGNYICSEVWVPLPVGAKLYALPGAKGEEK